MYESSPVKIYEGNFPQLKLPSYADNYALD
jgi:hypothetical protein